MLRPLWIGFQRMRNQLKETSAFSEREIQLILMYREIDQITATRIQRYSYFDVVFKTTQNVLNDLKNINRFPELEALKAQIKKREKQ
jgi:hypothetical protein